MKLTILTPTFNREKTLGNLYESLKKQTNKDFEWLVVDDGSSDNTKICVDKWIKDNEISIRYIYKENGGKHTALNVGIETISSELTFIVDSDDWLTSNAVDVILRYHRRYVGNKNLCGYAFLRSFPDGKINGKKFVPNEMITSYIDSRINSDDMMSDKAEVFYTKCLKEFPFPEYENEKFLGEDIVWIQMAKRYQMVHINQAIYIGNYLEDGLTSNRRKHNIQSPLGCMNRAKEFMCPRLKMKYRFKAAVQYIVYGRFAEFSISSLINNSPNKKLSCIVAIPSLCLYRVWKYKYN